MKLVKQFTFDSISELGDAVAQAEQSGTYFMDPENGSKDCYNFTDTPFSLDEATQRAQHGGYWEEGAKNLQQTEIEIEAKHEGQPELLTDLVGFLPNVPAYIAGHPDNMFDMLPGSGKRKFVKIGVHIGGNAMTSQQGRLNRGRAIMSVINDLELQGYSVELWGVWRNDNGKQRVMVDVCIKHAAHQWNEHVAAFALANTAFQRRLVWRLVESDKQACKIGGTFGGGGNAPHDDFDVYFPYLSGDSGYNSPEQALDSVTDRVQSYINQ